MRRTASLLLLTLLLSPGQAAARWVEWRCLPTARLVCTVDAGCSAAEPRFGEVAFDREYGRLSYCLREICFEGVINLEQEGAPDWRILGVGVLEKLPLSRLFRGGESLFASYDTNARSLTLSALGPRGQDTTWFACEAAEW